jgi:hypothetical protein
MEQLDERCIFEASFLAKAFVIILFFTTNYLCILLYIVFFYLWDIRQIITTVKAYKKLDDGWPESVEEQGLLLLVWRHHITKQYIKDVL